MVVSPDLGAQTSVLQRRADIVLDEVSLLVREHVHGGIAGLAVQGLVLEGDGVDGGAVGLIGLDVLDKVLGKGGRVLGTIASQVTIVEVVVGGGAVNGVVELHPAGRAPGGSEDLEVGVEALHLGQHLGHGSTTVTKVEAGEVGVGIATIVVVGVGWVSRQVRGTNGVTHEGEASTSRSHQLVEQRAERAGRQLVERSDGGIGHGSTKSGNLLLVTRAGVVDGQVPGGRARRSVALNRSRDGGQLVVAGRVGGIGLGTSRARAVSRFRRQSNGEGGLASEGGDERGTHFRCCFLECALLEVSWLLGFTT